MAAHTLGIPHEKVHIMETGTDTVPNTPPTAASAGSDLNGMAVLEACTEINSRLEKFKVWCSLASAMFHQVFPGG